MNGKPRWEECSEGLQEEQRAEVGMASMYLRRPWAGAWRGDGMRSASRSWSLRVRRLRQQFDLGLKWVTFFKCSAAAILKFSIISERGALNFHFALSLANYVAGPDLFHGRR